MLAWVIVGMCGTWFEVLHSNSLLTGATCCCGAVSGGLVGAFGFLLARSLGSTGAPPAEFRSTTALLSIWTGRWLPSVKTATASTWLGELKITREALATTLPSPKALDSCACPAAVREIGYCAAPEIDWAAPPIPVPIVHSCPELPSSIV